MRKGKLGRALFGVLGLVACSGGESLPQEDVGSADAAIVRSSSLGGRNEVVMVYAIIGFDAQGQPVFRTCSGAYFAPRVVLTAAHCLQNVVSNQLFVYWGDNFAADVAQLTPQGAFRVPPAVGQPSFWSQAESFEQHPSWDPNLIHPDMGAIYLDRRPPFDPLPLARFRLDNSWNNRQVTISGWGADQATGGTSGTGSRVQRTGTTRILGTPTAADYHPEDPNPGMQVASVRQNVLKMDGRAPNANACFGDSGSPLLVTQNGQTYIAGVEYFGGLFCDQYSLYTRLDGFLPFLDEAYRKGGQHTVTPRTECIAPRTGGGFRAYFGYDNKNGIAINIPYGSNNSFAQDTAGLRPSKFLPGNHKYVFGVNFAANQTLSYRVVAPSGPNTLLTVNSNSPRCNVNDRSFICAQRCDAELQAQCGWNLADCTADCLTNYGFVTPCEAQFDTYNRCIAGLSASAFICDDVFAYDVSGGCDAPLNDLFSCLGG
ncbi:MAG: trypsin-like serine protease [Polyangiaceae bacterium]